MEEVVGWINNITSRAKLEEVDYDDVEWCILDLCGYRVELVDNEGHVY